MRKLAVLMVFMLFPVVAALPTYTQLLPEEPKVGDTITREQTFSDDKFIHWEDGWTMLIAYFYPFDEDIETRYGGTWRHIETHEEGIIFNISFNRYINWSSENYTPIPFYLKSFKFSWGTNEQIFYNVTEGFDSGISSNATVSEEGLEDGVSIAFQMTTGMELIYCELITVINMSITFVTTWKYWVWVCGGVVPSDTRNTPVLQLALIIGVIFSGAYITNRWDKRGNKNERKERNTI